MIYPDRIEEKLGFDLIRNKLMAYCLSDLGRKKIASISFSSNLATIEQLLNEVDEFVRLTTEEKMPETGKFEDINPLIAKSKIKGNWISSKELLLVSKNISGVILFSNYIENSTLTYRYLKNLLLPLSSLAILEKKLILSIDEDGEILNTASKNLKSIRQKINIEERALRKSVELLFKKAKLNGFVPEGSSIGIRDGRMVIPVLASSKRQIQGFIHDESASGNIVFLEPTEVLNNNNAIRELHFEEGREIRKILIDLTGLVNIQRVELNMGNDFLAKIDCIWAKTKLAKALGSVRPKLSIDELKLKELKHPLLIAQAMKNKKEVISHDIKLDDNNRMLVVSGPNAGGKSVVLKSMGLNQMMVQSGILPCCAEGSVFKIFDNLLIDIGDEQSIESDLSTYSSHLNNMGIMLKYAAKETLILIDEFGSGTDPSFGGVIAEAVLFHLNNKKCLGIITTHFSNLKIFADKTSGIINGAMVFDKSSLKPKYELEIGHPGSSFSLEMAKESGLPKQIIKMAREALGEDTVEVEDLLNKLEGENLIVQKKIKKLIEREDQLSKLTERYNKLNQEITESKRRIINEAKKTASDILAKTNKEIEKTIRHIKENKAEKKETSRIRKSLNKFSEQVTPEKENIISQQVTPIKGKIGLGDKVIIKNTDVIAVVSELKGSKAKLLIGDLQSIVPIVKLQRIANDVMRNENATKSLSNITRKVISSMAKFSPNLDVRGTRAVDLLPIIQRFLDDALVLNQTQVKIIHGKGNGVLRKIIREELKQWPQILNFADEHIDHGGSGATIVHL